jgi:hypothetical protein
MKNRRREEEKESQREGERERGREELQSNAAAIQHARGYRDNEDQRQQL